MTRTIEIEVMAGSPAMMACYAGWLMARLERAGFRGFRARMIGALVTDKLTIDFMTKVELDVANVWKKAGLPAPAPALPEFLGCCDTLLLKK